MLHYAQLIPDETQRQEHVRTAIEDFKDSIQAHKELQSLTSREEFYVFACAVYKLAIACQAMPTQHSIQQTQHIGKMSTLLYEHYCSFPGMILLDEEITKLITHCLNFLQLNSFCDERLPRTEGLVEDIGDRGQRGTEELSHTEGWVEDIADRGQGGTEELSHTEGLEEALGDKGQGAVEELSQADGLVEAIGDRGQVAAEELSHTPGSVEDIGDVGLGAVISSGTKGEVDAKVPNSFSWQIPNLQCPAFQANIDTANKEFTFANHEAVMKVRHEEHSVTDKLKKTREHMTKESDCTDVFFAVISNVSVYSGKNANDSNLTVDRCCNTRDSGCSVTMETVDRSVVTQDLEQETTPLSYGRFVPPQSTTIETQLQGGLNLDSSQRVQGNKFDMTMSNNSNNDNFIVVTACF